MDIEINFKGSCDIEDNGNHSKITGKVDVGLIPHCDISLASHENAWIMWDLEVHFLIDRLSHIKNSDFALDTYSMASRGTVKVLSQGMGRSPENLLPKAAYENVFILNLFLLWWLCFKVKGI